MAIEIDSLTDLKDHLDGVMQRSDHHAQQVYKIVLILVGLITWKAKSITARTREGKMGNMVWFTDDNDKRYAVVFNHDNAKIDIRENSQQGRILLDIDNDTNLDDSINFFERM